MEKQKIPLSDQVEFYDTWNRQHRSGDIAEIPAALRLRSRRLLLELDSLLQGVGHRPRILEVGCGTGWFSVELASRGHVTAIDLSPKAIDIARARRCDAEFVAGDFLTHDFGDEPFDAGVCVETLFYVEDQEQFVERFAALLAPGAPIGVTSVNPFVYERMSAVPPPAHGQVRQWLGRRELRALLEPRFEILTERTLHPAGDQGVLRLANSYKVNAVLGRAFGADNVRRAKERAGLGEGILIMGRKRG